MRCNFYAKRLKAVYYFCKKNTIADVGLCSKYASGNDKKNYKFVSTLPNLPSVFKKQKFELRQNISACLFSVHSTIRLSRHEQICVMRLRFERYFYHHPA